MGYLIIGLRNLNRRRGRAAVTSGAIAVIIVAFFSLAALNTAVSIAPRAGFGRAIGQQVGFPYFADMTIVGQKGFRPAYFEVGRPVLIPPLIADHAELLSRLDGLEAVAAAAPRLGSFSVTRWEVQRGDGEVVRPQEGTWRPITSVQGIDPRREQRLRGLGDAVIQGEYLRPGDTSGILIGYEAARVHQVGVGDRVRLWGQGFEGEFTIAGIFLTNTPDDRNRLFVTLEAAQGLVGLEGTISEIAVVARAGRLPEAAQGVAESTAHEVLFPSLEMVPELGTVLSLWSARTTELANTEALVLLGILGWLFAFQAMLTSVFDRTREIGILKAIGWAREDVLRSTMVEAALLGALGGGVGYGLGIAAPALLGALGLGPIFLLEPTLLEAAGCVGLATLISLAAALIPADMAAAIPPLEAMRRA